MADKKIKKEVVKKEVVKKEVVKTVQPKKVANKIKSNNPNLISFDVYFMLSKVKNKNIKNHHKEAMQKFAEAHRLLTGTKEQFDKVFEKY